MSRPIEVSVSEHPIRFCLFRFCHCSLLSTGVYEEASYCQTAESFFFTWWTMFLYPFFPLILSMNSEHLFTFSSWKDSVPKLLQFFCVHYDRIFNKLSFVKKVLFNGVKQSFVVPKNFVADFYFIGKQKQKKKTEKEIHNTSPTFFRINIVKVELGICNVLI